LSSHLVRTAQTVLALPRPLKRTLALVVDGALCVLTVWLAFYLRLDLWLPWQGTADNLYRPYLAALAALAIALPLFVVNGFYRVIFRYTDWAAAQTLLRVFALYAVLYAGVVTVLGLPGVPRSVGIIQPLLLGVAVGATRALARYWLGGLYQDMSARSSLPKALIYGAGQTGRELARVLAHSQELKLAGYIDDDERLHGQVLGGLPIVSPADVPALVNEDGVRTVLLAMPKLGRARRNQILETLRPLRVALRTLPRWSDAAHGRISSADLHELDVDDLLGREPVAPNHILLAKNIVGKVVLVTGAGGSIGSEICRQIVRQRPAVLLLLENNEYALYALERELHALCADGADDAEAGEGGAGGADGLSTSPTNPDDSFCGGVRRVPLLANVQDAARLDEIMRTWRPDTVYHAAAYKHVPLVEHNPAEGIRNNVWGTLRAAQAAAANGVSDFVLVSTDKAVRPTNVMGASKRLAELALQALAAEPALRGRTRMCMVRFGNVLGSSGSVVPLFRQQIRDGGPITLTHPEVTRFFMTIPEAAQLVIQAGAMAKGGDVFVLDMGQPVRIYDLAQRMVELSGLTLRDAAHPQGDIGIEISGLRPGEKLYEELLIGNDPQPTVHPRIMKAHEASWPWPQLQPKLATLELALQVNDVALLRLLLQELVEGYTPDGEIVDWVHLEQAVGQGRL